MKLRFTAALFQRMEESQIRREIDAQRDIAPTIENLTCTHEQRFDGSKRRTNPRRFACLRGFRFQTRRWRERMWLLHICTD